MEYVERGQRFFTKHGDKSILLARFIGPLRPVIPFVAGLFQMRALKFFLFNIVGGFLAALFYLSLGYFFGQATGQLHTIFGAVEWFFGGLIVVIILILLFKRYLAKRGQEITGAIHLVFQPVRITFLEHHVRFRTWLEKREQARFPLIFWFSVSLAMVVAVLIGSGIAQKWLALSVVSTGDLSTVSWLYAERQGWLTVLFLIITGFGKSVVAALLVLLAALLVWKYKRKIYLTSLFISVGGASSMVELIKHLVARPRPEFIAIYHETGFSFPSGHAMFSAVFGGWIIFLIWHEAKQWATKVNVLFACVSMMVLVSFSRLYLGVHYPSDVVTGFLIGLIWLGIGTGVQKVRMRKSKLKSPT
jgi:undecaprenyl-diphosphatase